MMAKMNSVPHAVWKVISDTTLSAPQTVIDFTSFDINAEGAIIIECTILNSSGLPEPYNLYMAGDFIDADYRTTRVFNVGLSANNNNSDIVGGLANNGTITMFILISLDPSGLPTALVRGSTFEPGPFVGVFNNSHYLSVVQPNITSVRIAADNANGLGIGSRFIVSEMKSL